MTRGRGRRGFTLVEMVISIVVVCIISGLLAVTLRQAFEAWAAAGGRKELLQEARAILLRTEREVRQARDRGSVLVAGPRALSIRTCADSTVGLSWSGSAGAPLLYLRNGRSYVFGAAVDSFALAYWREDGTVATPVVAPDSTDVRRLSVYLRLARGGQRVALRQGIALRNGGGG
jgi:prepilin-type N-terminal cleavage/methylation domain-containing protein